MNKKVLGIIGLIALIVVLYVFTPLKDILSRDNIDSLKLWIQGTGGWAPFIYVGIYVAAVIFCLPGSVLTLVGGLIFGIGWGTLLVVIAANVGAFCAFIIARYLGRDAAEKFLRGHVGKLDEGIATHGFYVVLWMRLIPIFPFNALNYAFGLSKVKVRDLVLGNLLGMLPGTFVYVSLGNAASHVSLTDPEVWTRMEVWGPFVLIIILSLIPKIFKKKQSELKGMTKRD